MGDTFAANNIQLNNALPVFKWPAEYPLSTNEMSILLPHLLKDGRGKVDTYFSRVYNPIWTNPDGFSWIEALTDESLVGLHVALTPTWSETAMFADYVLPMGHGPERHDTQSYEQYGGKWLGFRQPVRRVAMERLGEPVDDTRAANPGEVWEENEFWFELSWRIDPDGSLGIRKYFEAPDRPGEKVTVDDYYGWVFDNTVPGLPEKAKAHGMTPLEYMRRYGVYEIGHDMYRLDERSLTSRRARRSRRRRPGRPAQADDSRLHATAGRRGGCRRRRAGRRVAGGRLADAVASTRALLADHGRLRLAGVRDTGLHRLARRAQGHRRVER